MDFNLKKAELHTSKKKSKFKKTLPVIGLVILAIGIVSWYLFAGSSITVFDFNIPHPLKSSPERINVLLLGNAGGLHDGPSLTDSMIVASYHLKSGKVALISIPRDLWVRDTNTKVNALYERGEKNGSGLEFTKEKLEQILGLKIDYGVRLDFSGFAKAVDLVEGIDVEVPKTFDDFNYPIEGKEDDLCGYKEEEIELTEEKIKDLNIPTPLPSNSVLGNSPLIPGKRKLFLSPEGKIATDSGNIVFTCRLEHIHFDQGLLHLDGTIALKFVRSRMGTNNEGSDFARSRRQQLVLQAFRSKALSLETLFNPVKLAGLISTFGDSVETDIPTDKYLEFYNLFKNMESTESIVLGDLKKDNRQLLIVPPAVDYGGAFVLIPAENDFSILQEYLKQILIYQLEGTPAPLPTANP